MMDTWKTTLSPGLQLVRLLVTDPTGDERLKARLPLPPAHPRALLTLLEGLALWTGQPLCAAISVVGPSARSSVAALFGGAVWPPESALVQFYALDHPRRRRTIPGVGDFQQLRRVHRDGRSA